MIKRILTILGMYVERFFLFLGKSIDMVEEHYKRVPKFVRFLLHPFLTIVGILVCGALLLILSPFVGLYKLWEDFE